jgi:hypothetical protein
MARMRLTGSAWGRESGIRVSGRLSRGEGKARETGKKVSGNIRQGGI